MGGERKKTGYTCPRKSTNNITDKSANANQASPASLVLFPPKKHPPLNDNLPTRKRRNERAHRPRKKKILLCLVLKGL
jgi:hypothetical protein